MAKTFKMTVVKNCADGSGSKDVKFFTAEEIYHNKEMPQIYSECEATIRIERAVGEWTLDEVKRFLVVATLEDKKLLLDMVSENIQKLEAE